jgi:DNA repair protein RecO (recombination protein O)
VSALHTEALVLRTVDVGESDRILHLLTPGAGRIAAVAKGARRSRRRFPGTLDLFNLLFVQLETRRSGALARIENARLVRTWAGLRSHPTRFALGCYLLELLDRLAPEGGARSDRHRVFAFATGALALVDAQQPDPRLRALLELRALDALGLRPELGRCVRCGRVLGGAGAACAGFCVPDGGPLCAACAPPGAALLPVHLGTLRALERALRFDLSHLGRIALGGAALGEARTLVARFLRYHVGLELRSVPFLEERLTPPEPKGKLRPSEAC